MDKKGDMAVVLALIGAAAILLLLFAVVGYELGYALTDGEEKITVKEKWEKRSGDTSKYLVSSTNGQVFQITDTFIKWGFDSSNLYADLSAGDRCKIKTQGWRFPFLSDYKNILEADCFGSNDE